MKHFFKEIIKDILLFVAVILVYEALLVLIFPNLKLFGTRFGAVKDAFKFIFTGEIFNYPKFLWIFVIFIGIPAVIIRRVSNRLSNKLNFIIVPLSVIAVFSLILPSLYILIFKIELSFAKFLFEELLNFYITTSIVFQVAFSFIVTIQVMIKRKKQATPIQ